MAETKTFFRPQIPVFIALLGEKLLSCQHFNGTDQGCVRPVCQDPDSNQMSRFLQDLAVKGKVSDELLPRALDKVVLYAYYWVCLESGQYSPHAVIPLPNFLLSLTVGRMRANEGETTEKGLEKIWMCGSKSQDLRHSTIFEYKIHLCVANEFYRRLYWTPQGKDTNGKVLKYIMSHKCYLLYGIYTVCQSKVDVQVKQTEEL